MFTIIRCNNPKEYLRQYIQDHSDEMMDFLVSKGYSIQLRYQPEEWVTLDQNLRHFFDDYQDEDYYDFYKDMFGPDKYFFNTKNHIAQVMLDGYQICTRVRFDNDDMESEDRIVFLSQDLPEPIEERLNHELKWRNEEQD